MRHHLRTSMTVPRPLAEVFPFFAEASNLQRITPAGLDFRILTPMPIPMREGTRIDYELRLAGIRFGWTSRISKWEPPHVFVDEQVRGPYREWIHTHAFEASEEGTLMTDHVAYRLPIPFLGEIGYPLVSRQLRRIFRYRREAVLGIFEGGPEVRR